MAIQPGKKINPQTQSLTLESLPFLADGQAKAAINAALATAIRDTEDRGEDKKKRKVTIELEFEKIGSENVSVTVRAKPTIPTYTTKPTIGLLTFDGRNAEMKFSPTSADNPDQMTLGGDEG